MKVSDVEKIREVVLRFLVCLARESFHVFGKLQDRELDKCQV